MICLFSLLTSCGSNTNDSTNRSERNPVRTMELSPAENEFIQDLLKKGSMEQSELMKTLANLPDFSQETLKKFDRLMILSCSQSNDRCYFSSKE